MHSAEAENKFQIRGEQIIDQTLNVLYFISGLFMKFEMTRWFVKKLTNILSHFEQVLIVTNTVST